MSEKLRGTVLEVNSAGKYLLIITPDRNYLKILIPREVPEIGKEIYFNNADLYRNYSAFRKWMLTAAAILFIMGASALLNSFFSVTTYVALDINPGVELEVNRYNRVIGVDSLNSDGNVLKSSVNVNYLKMEEALENLINNAKEKQYLDGETVNVIMLSYSDKGDSVSHLNTEELETEMVMLFENLDIPYHVIVNRVTPDLKKQSQKEGISMNHLLLLDLMKENDIAPAAEDVKGNLAKLVEEIESDLGELPSSLVGKKNMKQGDTEESGFPDSSGQRKPDAGKDVPEQEVPDLPDVPEQEVPETPDVPESEVPETPDVPVDPDSNQDEDNVQDEKKDIDDIPEQEQRIPLHEEGIPGGDNNEHFREQISP